MTDASTCRCSSRRRWSGTSSASSRRRGRSGPTRVTSGGLDSDARIPRDQQVQTHVGAQDAPGRRPHPWPARDRGRAAAAVLGAGRVARHREAAALRGRQRRAQPRRGRGEPGGLAGVGRRRPDAEAVPPTRVRPRHACAQAHIARDRRGAHDERRARSRLVGHKIHPYGFRLGVIYPWKSNWYAERDYAEFLHEDIWIRKHVKSRLTRAGISSIDIERKGDQIWVFIRTARPGIVIGRKGAEVDRLRKDIERYTKKRVDVKVEDMNQASSEVRPETDAALLAQNVAEQLQGRVAFRRAMRRAVQTAMRSGALGVRVAPAGSLGGTEMGRKEWFREGRVPLHTLRAKVDFGTAEAKTTMGAIGVKVWIYRGDEVPYREQETERARARASARARGGGPRSDRPSADAARPAPTPAAAAAAPAPAAPAPASAAEPAEPASAAPSPEAAPAAAPTGGES